ESCGKLVVATRKSELAVLDRLYERGSANGLSGIQKLAASELSQYEPHVIGLAGLHVPQTGIVDYVEVANKFAELAAAAGCEIRKDCCLEKVQRQSSHMVLETAGGTLQAKLLINCAGLQSDRVARMCGVRPRLKIIPFRGEYYKLKPERNSLVRNLIYPVPDARFPFLGVHFTRMIGGGIEAGPNAVLALARHGYTRFSLSPRDLLDTLGYQGFWQILYRYWRMGLGELQRSFCKAAFVRELQRLIPQLQPDDIDRAGAGVRAQAVAPNGLLVDDFYIERDDRSIHVLNAPSPAATASISIGETIAKKAREHIS
ncbi:MAG: L-2-hydroxyglutarate oxidase, partial [Planctomycetales bacterium]